MRKMLGGGAGGNAPLDPQQGGSEASPNTGGGLRGIVGSTATSAAGLIPQGIVNAVRDRKMAGQVSTLLLRIQTSTVGRDRRDAITELCDLKASDVAEHITNENLSMLLMVAEMNRNDTQLLTKILEFLSSITEERVINDTVREAILHELLEHHVSVFLDSLASATPSAPTEGGGAGGIPNSADELASGGLKRQTFWVRYHAIKILQRLQEYDSINLQKQLLTSNKLGAIIDILHDDTNDGALRSEGMILLEHITMTDMELQTILAFDSCFETLLGIVVSEGGVNGDVTSVDCLRVIHNMLRNNKATQKFFREMGLASSLKPLLVDTCAVHSGAGSPDGNLTPKGLEIVLSAIDIIQCLLRFGDNNGEGAAARDSLTNSGLVEPLCRVAFSSKLDDRTTVAALRTIALLAISHKPTGEQLLATRINTKDAANVPGLWACLHTALYHSDLTFQAAALQIVGAAMQTTGTGAQVASFLVKGLAPATGGAAAIASQQSGKEGGLQCGLLLSLCLMNVSPPTPNSRYYAAWVLNQAIQVREITEQMIFLPWQGRTFFLAYVRQLEEMIRTRQCNLATVAMLIRPLFTWFAFCEKGVLVFLGGTMTGATTPRPNNVGPQGGVPPNTNGGQQSTNGGLNSFNFFLEWSNNTRDPMHLRFLCAMVCVAAALACPAHDLPPSVQTNKDDLIRRFCSAVRLGMLEELLYNVSQSPEWKEPPVNILHTRSNALILYDKEYVDILTKLSSFAQRWLSGPPPTSQLQSPVDPTSARGSAVASPNFPPQNNQQPLPPGGFRPPMPVHSPPSQQTPSAATSNNNAATQQNQAQQQKLQQQLQQYETVIRQLQSELKTRDDAIVDLTEANEKLIFENEELTQQLSANGGSAARGGSKVEVEAAVREKDAEIKSLLETVRKLEARLGNGGINPTTSQNHPLIPTLPLAALGNGAQNGSLPMTTPRGNPLQSTPGALDTGRSVASNYTTMTDIDALQIRFEEASMKLRVLESERDELLILVAELDEENEILKQLNEPDAKAGESSGPSANNPPPQAPGTSVSVPPTVTTFTPAGASSSSVANTPRPILKQSNMDHSHNGLPPIPHAPTSSAHNSKSSLDFGLGESGHNGSKNISATASLSAPPPTDMTHYRTPTQATVQSSQVAPPSITRMNGTNPSSASQSVASPTVTNPDPFGMEASPNNTEFISSIFSAKPPPPTVPLAAEQPQSSIHDSHPSLRMARQQNGYGHLPIAPPTAPPSSSAKTVSFAEESTDLR